MHKPKLKRPYASRPYHPFHKPPTDWLRYMSVHRLRRRPNIKVAFFQCAVSAWPVTVVLHTHLTHDVHPVLFYAGPQSTLFAHD